MYRFSPGDKAVLFLDCFGLTRLELPRKVKTDRKVRGSWDSTVSLSDRGDQAMVYDANWWRTYAYEFPALKPSHKYERFRPKEAQVLGSGKHMLVEYEWVQTLGGKDTGSIDDSKAKKLRALDLWATRDLGYYIHEAFPAGPLVGDTFARFDAPQWEWELSFGRCDRKGGELLWRRPIRVHGGHRHGLYPHADGVVITSAAPRAGQVFARDFDAAGEPGATFEAAGYTVPVAAHGRLAWQEDADTVVVREASGATRSFSIAAATARAHSAKKHPRALPKGDFLGRLENSGEGTILLGEEALLFVPWHGETILDLIGGAEIHRKLPPEEYAVRRHFRATVARAAAFGRDADMTVNGGVCLVNAKQRTFQTGFSATRGEGGLVGLLVGGALAAMFNTDPTVHTVDGMRWSGGYGGATDYLSGACSDEDLLRAFALFDDHAFPIYWATSGLRDVYARRLGEDSLNHHEEVPGRVLSRESEHLLMHALLASAAEAPRYENDGKRVREPSFKLMKRVAGWRKKKLDEAAFRKQAAKVHHENGLEGSIFDLLARSYFHDGPFAKE
ncbi:MAG: hypothetical protein KC486_36065 [Myxococcales bacterium]|nr:hypothetical protein [Myxococcales bacterium]